MEQCTSFCVSRTSCNVDKTSILFGHWPISRFFFLFFVCLFVYLFYSLKIFFTTLLKLHRSIINFFCVVNLFSEPFNSIYTRLYHRYIYVFCLKDFLKLNLLVKTVKNIKLQIVNCYKLGLATVTLENSAEEKIVNLFLCLSDLHAQCIFGLKFTVHFNFLNKNF